MDGITLGILAFAVLLILLLMGVSCSTSMGIVGVGGMLILLGNNAAMLKCGANPYDDLSSYTYGVIPMFILMAQIIACTGIGEALFDACYKWFGRFKGGLAMATIIACGVFAAVSASAVATAITIGMIALPQMRRLGYSDTLSTGSIASGGTLGIMIPPSGILIFYGIMTNQSISKLFLAGVIPGIITIILFCIATAIICKINPKAGPSAPKFTMKEKVKSLGGCIDIVILIIFVLGGMFANWFTPTESGALGAAGAIILTLIRRKLNWKNLLKAIEGALLNTGVVFFILICGNLMNYFMSASGLPGYVANGITSLGLGRIPLILLMILIYLFLGMFLDGMPMILLTIPIFYPVIQSMGMDPIWFGIICVFCVQMAAITPPVGINVYVVKGLDDNLPIATVFKGIFPYLACMIIAVLLMIFIPDIVTFIPNLLMK